MTLAERVKTHRGIVGAANVETECTTAKNTVKGSALVIDKRVVFSLS